MPADYYQILGISRTANKEEIKRAYRRLAKVFHPDINNNEPPETFRKIVEAYETLSNEGKRYSYDLKFIKKKASTGSKQNANFNTASFYRQYQYYGNRNKPGELPEQFHKPFYASLMFVGFVMIFLPIFAVVQRIELFLTLVLVPAGIKLVWVGIKELKIF